MKLHRHTNYQTRLSRVFINGAALGAAIFAVSALQAQNTTNTDSKISHRAKEFLKEAAQANQTEIAMANVAEGKTQNTQVKELAHMMLTDHQQNYAQVQALAQAHGMTLESGLGMLNQHAVNRLQKANDTDFDREYCKVMLKDHVKCIKRFHTAASDIEEQDIKQYAQDTLPTLRHHLEKSEEAARSAGLDEAAINSILKDLPSEDRAVTTR